MTKTFRQLLSESTAPKKVATKKTTATTKKNTKPVAAKAAPKTAKKVIKESNELTLSDLGFVAPTKAKLDEAAWVIPAPAPTYVDRGESKYDDSIFDLDASDIGLVFESFGDEEGDEEPRDEQNSVDTAEDTDGTPPVGAASMSNKEAPGADEGDDEEAGETASGKPTYQTVTFTVPALMHVLKVIAHKAPDKVTLNSMVMSMAHHCATDGNTVDVDDLEEIKHKMHGMEYNGGDAGAVGGDEEAQDAPGPNPSIYATDDVIDGAGEAPEGDEDESGEGDEGEAPEASQDDAQGATKDGEKTADGKTQLDDEDEEESEEKPADKPDFAKKDDAEKDDSGEEESAEEGEAEDEEKEDDLDESMTFDIESVFESVGADEMRMIRRRAGLKYWD